MDWRSTKFLLATTATIAVGFQVVKKLYNHITKSANQAETVSVENGNSNQTVDHREINDVLIFSNYNHCSDSHACNGLSTKKERLHERELNCIKLMQYIHASRETLDVCMYLITSSEIVEQIIRLGQKHILVRILVDHDMAYSPQSQIKRLMQYSFIQVQTSKQSILMHHKFCIIDGPKAVKRKAALKTYAEELNVHLKSNTNHKTRPKNKLIKGFVMSGSLNWSTQAMITNHESVIVTSQYNIVSKFEKEFESLWVDNEPFLKGRSS